MEYVSKNEPGRSKTVNNPGPSAAKFKANNCGKIPKMLEFSKNGNRIRHPLCKHSHEELWNMARKLQHKNMRIMFMCKTFNRGEDPYQTMEFLLRKDQNPNSQKKVTKRKLKMMAKTPKKELDKLAVEYPELRMRMFSEPEVQELLARKLQTKQLAQQPLVSSSPKPSRVEKRVTLEPSDRPKIEGLATEGRPLTEDSALETGSFQNETSGKVLPTNRPLKDSFERFILSGMSITQAIDKVKELGLQGLDVTKGSTCRGGVCPGDVETVKKTSSDVGESSRAGASLPDVEKTLSDVGESTRIDRKSPLVLLSKKQSEKLNPPMMKLSKGQRRWQNRKFRQFDEAQKSDYECLRLKGWSHLNALLMIVGNPPVFVPGTRKHSGADNSSLGTSSSSKHASQAKIGSPWSSVVGSGSGVSGFRRSPVSSIPTTKTIDAKLGPKCSLPQPAEQCNMSEPQQQFQPDVKPMLLHQISGWDSDSHNAKALSRRGQDSSCQDTHHPYHEDIYQAPSSSDSLHLYIVPSGYPREHLSEEQMDAIENSILEALLEIDDESMKPIFNGSFRNNGRYKIICNDQFAKDWLYMYASHMFKLRPNTALKIIPAEPTKIRASAVLPLSKNDDNNKILAFIAKQNSCLNVGQWEIAHRSDVDSNTYLSLLVDEESAVILKNRIKINFKMGSAKVVIAGDDAEHQSSDQIRNSDASSSASYPGIGIDEYSFTQSSNVVASSNPSHPEMGVDEHYFTRRSSVSLWKEGVQARDNDRYRRLEATSRRSRSERRHDRLSETASAREFEQFDVNRYDRNHSEHDKGSTERVEYLDVSSSIHPSSSRSDHLEGRGPKFDVARRWHPGYGQGQFAERRDVLSQGMDDSTSRSGNTSNFSNFRESCGYIEPSLHDRTSPYGDYQERHTQEQSARERLPRRTRWDRCSDGSGH